MIPPLAQKHLISMANAGYTPTSKVVSGLAHLGFNLTTNCIDNGVTYVPVHTLLEAYWPIAGNSFNSHKWNFINNSIHLMTVGVSVPTESNNLVTFIGTGVASYRTDINPNTLGLSQSHGFGYQEISAVDRGNVASVWSAGGYAPDGTVSSLLSAAQSGGASDAGIDNDYNLNLAVTNSVSNGFWDIVRNGTTLTLYKNGISFGTRTRTATANPNITYDFGGTNQNGTHVGIGPQNMSCCNMWVWKNSPTATQELSFYNAANKFHTTQ